MAHARVPPSNQLFFRSSVVFIHSEEWMVKEGESIFLSSFTTTAIAFSFQWNKRNCERVFRCILHSTSFSFILEQAMEEVNKSFNLVSVCISFFVSSWWKRRWWWEKRRRQRWKKGEKRIGCKYGIATHWTELAQQGMKFIRGKNMKVEEDGK